MFRKKRIKIIVVWVAVFFAMYGQMLFDYPHIFAQTTMNQEMIMLDSDVPPGFPGDTSDCDIDCQLIEIARQRVASLQSQVQEKVKDIQTKHNELNLLKALQANFKEIDYSFADDSTPETPFSGTMAGLKEKIIRNSAKFDEDNRELGRSLMKIRMKQDVEDATNLVQSRIDSYTIELEQDFISLQTLNTQLQEAITLLNNLLKKQGTP